MKILKRNIVWNMALTKEALDFSFDKKLAEPFKVFRSKKIRKSKDHVHTKADPFLFVNNKKLYLFFESQAIGCKGKIDLIWTEDLENYKFEQDILVEDHHLSYPFVFGHGSSIYMIPESEEANEVSLYRFEDFPRNPKKIKTLLKGRYADSSLIFVDDTCYLFTTSGQNLELFYSRDLLTEDFVGHPLNPISTDSKLSRCGGGIVSLNNKLFRLAQDCSGEYGRNLNILEVIRLSEKEYQEEIVAENYFISDQEWNSRGGHHLSAAVFHDKLITATDGKQNDYLLNSFLSPLFKFIQ